MAKTKILIFYAIFSTLALSIETAILKDTTGKVQLSYVKSSNGIDIELVRDGKVQLSGKLGVGKNLEKVSCIGQSLCTFGENDKLAIKPVQHGFNIAWVSGGPDAVYEDCYNLNSNTSHWYGGPQRARQVWPLEKMTISGDEPYVIKRSDNFAVAERYWLNSRGVFIFLADIVPLWIDQNNKLNDQVCFKAEAKAPYINRYRVVLDYYLVSLDGPRTGHYYAVRTYLGTPVTHPNELMITEPIWTTWARYKKPINDSIVLEFANEIRSHGYTGGQLEIDDNWETCYGAQEFDPVKFGNISNTISTLHNDSWRVSLWVHPFVNDDCQNNSRIGQELGYFVKNTTGQTHATWWNGDNAHQIDFTVWDAKRWWQDRLVNILDNYGIDSFKFDAGETDYANQPNEYVDAEVAPNILTQNYIESCIAFGDLIEVRASFRGQRWGEFVRMLDKASTWTLDNGLPTLITTLLQFNMNGYGMVLPDMIGGNGYAVQPTGELLVRWTQANTFMPAMQFSYLPWDFKDQVSYDIEAIVKKFVDLHIQYSPNIILAMNQSISYGMPVNPPIWWIDPTDPIALASDDEYLLGDQILVAPVIVEGSVSRDVYLPLGQWQDGNNGTVYTGPITLKDYPAPIDVLPYFIKSDY